MNDFLATDLLVFVPTKDWSDDEKAAFAVQFGQVGALYLLKQFEAALPVDADQRYEQLLQTQPTVTELLTFYNELLPGFDQSIDQKATDFKKLFLTRLYSDKAERFVKLSSQLAESDPQRLKLEQAALTWHRFAQLANNDQWEDVVSGIAALKS